MDDTPSSPLNLQGDYTGARTKLHWDPPLSSGASEIYAYRIYRAPTIFGDPSYVGEFVLIDEVTANVLRYEDGSAERYDHYYVVAVNGQGEGSDSNIFWTGYEVKWWQEPVPVIVISVVFVALAVISHLFHPKKFWMNVASLLTIFTGVMVLALFVLEMIHTPVGLFEIEPFSLISIVFGIGLIVCAMFYRSDGKWNRTSGWAAIAYTPSAFFFLYMHLDATTWSLFAWFVVPIGIAGGVIAIIVGSKKRKRFEGS